VNETLSRYWEKRGERPEATWGQLRAFLRHLAEGVAINEVRKRVRQCTSATDPKSELWAVLAADGRTDPMFRDPAAGLAEVKWEILRKLCTEKELKALELLGQGRTPEQAAKELGVQRNSVHQILSRVRKRIASLSQDNVGQ
jgi:DNA-directed RNA polymerase specialized sigma24 family protein